MSEPVVAIVGRPNVGKSTLFNRLIGSRQAIVDDKPGVTRDRNYGHVEWNGQSFMLIDTGGLLPVSRDMMDAAIREQVQIAMDESDLVLFVVDALTGITETDQDIARMLRRSRASVIVAVNKVDDERFEAEGANFNRLGLGEPSIVSAMKGRGSGDFLDRVTEQIEKSAPKDDDFEGIRLAITGKENVGKSSLVNMLLNKSRSIVSEIPGTTRDSLDSELRFQKRDYLLIDTAGLKRKAKIKENILFYSSLRTFRSIQRADVVIYMVDARVGLTRPDVQILNEVNKQRKGCVLLMNKWDLVEKDAKTVNEMTLDAEYKLGLLKYIPLLYVSVKDKKRLYRALEEATTVYDNMYKRVSTRELNDYFHKIIDVTQPPAVKGKEIKINYITQIPARFPLFAFFCNHPQLIQEPYRRFLENKLRERYGFGGVPVVLSFRQK